MKQALVIVAVLGVVDPTCTLKDICPHVNEKTGLRARPPESYMKVLKLKQMKALGMTGDPSQYEEDHVISLELCGAPRDPNNLTPQPWDRARQKDVMETRFHKAICAGQMKIEDAQWEIVDYE